MRKYLSILFFILSFGLQAQELELEGIPIANLKKMAKQFMHYGDQYSAVDVYKKIYIQRPFDYKVLLKLADLTFDIRDYHAAKSYYEKLVKDGGDEYYFYTYKVGLCMMYLGEYEDAGALFKTFSKKYKGDDAVALKKEIKVYTNGIKFIKKTQPENMEVEPVTGSINKPYTEFAPLMVGDSGLIYSSLKTNELITHDLNAPPAYELKTRFYKAEWKGDEWVVRGHLKGPFNDLNFDVGNGAFSLDGSRFYFTKCGTDDAGKYICKLFFSQMDTVKMEWMEPIMLPETVNQKGFTATQPSVGKDLKSNNEVVYFVSDMPGGQGGLDIWYTVYNLKMKHYEAPVNAGRKVNTTKDEMTPFIEKATSTMFYSSNGGIGYGGFDIYEVKGQLAKWTKPKNLGTPANSSYDDLYYVINEFNNAGFLVSNRDGAVALKHKNCCDDIFSFTYPERLRFEVEGEVVDSNGTPLENAIISLYLLGENNEEILVNRAKIQDTDDYRFSLLQDKDYKLQVYKEGYLNNSMTLSTKGYTYSKTFKKNVTLEKISYESVVIKNIYYEYDSARLTDSSIARLNKVLLPFLKENTHIIVEIGSHTDSRGPDAYNEELSQRRAQSVVDFFIQEGIDFSRIKAKGYGECCFIAPNDNEDGSDNQEGRALNRRTEFRIVGEIPGYTKLLYAE